METGWLSYLLLTLVKVLFCQADYAFPDNSRTQRISLDDYLNTCLDGVRHKGKPGPEGDLFAQCSPWTKRSCCTKNISKLLHTEKKWYDFDWNHCYRPLSPACRGHFIQDLCFYECSPNVGPWLVPVSMKIRNEKFVDIPLCKHECDLWWNDCKEDFTCTQNWARGFNWTTGTNTCPEGKSCKKFKDIYSSAEEFCAKLWDYSWKVVPDDQPCMKLWFDKDGGNPNDAVARRKAEEILGISAASTFNVPVLLLTGLLLVLNL